ncbi:MAG: hypothetical protein P8080_04485 [Gammaproteobacteria bacterium]
MWGAGRVLRTWLGPLIVVGLAGCAAWQPPPAPDLSEIRARALTETVRDVRLSAAVVSREEGRQIFGHDLREAGVQAVWVEVENRSPHVYFLLRAGTDPDYFSPLEVAWSFHSFLGGSGNAAIDDYFASMDFPNPVPPGETRAGFLFTNPHGRVKLFNVDLIGRKRMIPYTLMLPIPDDPPDETAVRLMADYAEANRRRVRDLGTLREALEGLPCCGEGPRGEASGDPLNVVVIGTLDDAGAALVRRGFRTAREPLDDEQRLFGRTADAVLRKGGQGGWPGIWLRLWATPLVYGDRLVVVGQAGRPVGGRFTAPGDASAVLHPEPDEARNFLVQDMLYSGGLGQLGFVGGAGSSGPGTGDAPSTEYQSDGLRAVMFFVTRPLDMADVEIIDWVPYLDIKAAGD